MHEKSYVGGLHETVLSRISLLTSVLITLTTLYATWRLWRFTLAPKWLHPDHPKRLPYLAPILGHVRGMSTNASKLFTYGREYFGNTREVFSLTVMGEEFYIVTSPEDVSAIYRNTTSLEFDPIVRDIMGAFGVNSPTLDKMFDKDPHVDGGKSWMDVCHDDFKVQMYPGTKLKILEAKLLGEIENGLTWEKISSARGMISTTPKCITLSLWKWCGHVLVDAATRAFFGQGLYKVAPNMLEDFFAFDEDGWKLHYKYPEFAAREMYQAKRNGEVAFAKYLALPKEKRADASWIVERMEQGMQDLGITDPGQRGPMLFALYRLINTNAYRLCFWCLAYLLHNPDLMAAIKSEIQPAFQSTNESTSPSLDISCLVDNCPLFSSFYDEILRIANDPIGTRLVTQKTTLAGKVLLPGRKILMPYRQLHFNPEVFGQNVNEFDPRRFLEVESSPTSKEKKRDPRKGTSWRPFGGGATHCPGRFLARREVCMFVAVVLCKFDLRLSGDGKQKFPVLDESIPAGGILIPVPGDEVIVEVRKRE